MKVVDAIINKSPALDVLMQDESSKKLLLRQMSQELQDRVEPLWKYPKEQVLAIFISSGLEEGESLRVGNLVWSHLRSAPFPFAYLSDERKDTSWAERGLVGIGMFYDFYESRWSRRAAPKTKYYVEEIKNVLTKNYKFQLALHTDAWIEFMRNTFSTTVN